MRKRNGNKRKINRNHVNVKCNKRRQGRDGVNDEEGCGRYVFT